MQRFKYSNYLFYIPLLLCLLETGLVKAASAPKTYSLVLASAAGTNLKWVPNNNRMFSGRSFYIEKINKNGKKRERLNLGFFHQSSTSDLDAEKSPENIPRRMAYKNTA